MAATNTPARPRRASIADAAAYVPCSTKTIRRRIADGTLTGYRFGKKILVDLDELDAALHVIPTTSGPETAA